MLQRPLLFFSSYAPLFGILAIRFERPALMYACIGLAGVAALLGIIWLHSRTNGPEMVIASVNNAGGEAASYLAGYLLPFVTVGATQACAMCWHTLRSSWSLELCTPRRAPYKSIHCCFFSAGRSFRYPRTVVRPSS